MTPQATPGRADLCDALYHSEFHISREQAEISGGLIYDAMEARGYRIVPVNAYEPLVKALRRIEPLLTPDDRGRNWMNNDLALEIVRAALATVTESDSGTSVESSPEREGGK